MEHKKLREEIIQLISRITETDIKRKDVKVNFIEGLDVDSLMALEIVAALEKKYKIEIKEEDLPKLGTIDDIVNLVEKLTKRTPEVNKKTKEDEKPLKRSGKKAKV